MTELTTPTSNQPKRRRGAPKGNQNALKHGFYSRRFRKAEIVDLDGHEFIGLKDEITMVRVVMRRVLDMLKDAKDLSQILDVLHGICKGSDSLTRMMKMELLLASKQGKLSEAIEQAIQELTKEWNLGVSDPPPENSD